MTTTQELLKSSFELNLNNYGPEDVERLNDWAIKAYAALEALQAENAQWRVDFKEMVIERNAELARLAEIEAGASPVEPSQAQPPAPSDTAITYMTGYSDGREWAPAPIPQQPSVPEGWKLAPIEPTEAMLEVGFFAENDVFDSAKTKRIHVWKDMLSAAPQPKEKQ